MTDHVWPMSLEVHARLGLPGDIRSYQTVGPTPFAVAITAQIHALSRLHPPGQKIRIGGKWRDRINENAQRISEQADSLGGD